MKITRKSSLTTIAAAAVLGLSFIPTDADAQWWRGSNDNGYSRTSGYDNDWRARRARGHQRLALKQDVQTVDRLAKDMLYQFTSDTRGRCYCRETVALINHMKTYSRKTDDLVRTSKGTCKCAFKKAAEEVRKTLTCVTKQSKKIRNLSCSVRGAIEQSCPIATRILKNVDRFEPPSVTNHGRPNHNPAPVYGRPVNNGHDNHNHAGHSHDDNPFALILSNLLRNR